MKKSELILQLQAIEGDPEVCIFNHERNASEVVGDNSGEGSTAGIYSEIEIHMVNTEEELKQAREDAGEDYIEDDPHAPNPTPFLALSFVDEYVEQHGEDIRRLHKKEALLNDLHEIINTPETDDFMKGFIQECAHQRERWGDQMHYHPFDFHAVFCKLLGKMSADVWDKNIEKFRHHLIAMGAVAMTAHRLTVDEHSYVQEIFDQMSNVQAAGMTKGNEEKQS